MKIKEIYYSSHFVRAFNKLESRTKQMAILKEKLFRNNCFDPKLETHKLRGSLKKYWAFSIDYKNRIIFEFIESNIVGFIDVGNHSIY